MNAIYLPDERTGLNPGRQRNGQLIRRLLIGLGLGLTLSWIHEANRQLQQQQAEDRRRREEAQNSRTSRRNVFVSFDYDNDQRLKEGLIGQSRYSNSPFNVADFSMKEAAPQSKWRSEARKRIEMCSVVVVMCGQHTDKAAGVSDEVKIARDLGKPYFLLRGHPDKKCVKPNAAKSSDKMYTWTWENLVKLLNGRR